MGGGHWRGLTAWLQVCRLDVITDWASGQKNVAVTCFFCLTKIFIPGRGW